MSATIAKTLGLTPAQASAVESEWERRSIRAGEVIVEKDEKPSFLAIVLSGSLSLISLSGSDIQLGPGEVVGEVAFLTHAGRTAQVVAREDGEIAVMRYDALQAMERSDPALALQMIKALAAVATRRLVEDYVSERRYLALIAHDGCKEDLLKMVHDNEAILSHFDLVSTASTGHLIEQQTGLRVRRKVASGPLGGDQEIGALLSRGGIVAVIFFRNPLASWAHQADVDALMRLCDVHRVPLATNMATATALLEAMSHRQA